MEANKCNSYHNNIFLSNSNEVYQTHKLNDSHHSTYNFEGERTYSRETIVNNYETVNLLDSAGGEINREINTSKTSTANQNVLIKNNLYINHKKSNNLRINYSPILKFEIAHGKNLLQYYFQKELLTFPRYENDFSNYKYYSTVRAEKTAHTGDKNFSYNLTGYGSSPHGEKIAEKYAAINTMLSILAIIKTYPFPDHFYTQESLKRYRKYNRYNKNNNSNYGDNDNNNNNNNNNNNRDNNNNTNDNNRDFIQQRKPENLKRNIQEISTLDWCCNRCGHQNIGVRGSTCSLCDFHSTSVYKKLKINDNNNNYYHNNNNNNNNNNNSNNNSKNNKEDNKLKNNITDYFENFLLDVNENAAPKKNLNPINFDDKNVYVISDSEDEMEVAIIDMPKNDHGKCTGVIHSHLKEKESNHVPLEENFYFPKCQPPVVVPPIGYVTPSLYSPINL